MNFTDFPITHIIKHRLRKKLNWFFPFTTYYRITLLIVRSKQFSFFFASQSKKETDISFFRSLSSLLLTLVSQLHHTRVRVLGKAYSKRRWRTIRERETEKTNKKEKERDSVWSDGFLSCACLFIYFCSGLCALYTLDSLSLSLSFSYIQTDRFQAAAGHGKRR